MSEVVAPPWAPGHVGHTPQRVSDQLRAARMAGKLSSSVVDAWVTDGRRYAAQAFPRLVNARVEATTLTLVRAHRISEILQPKAWPFTYRLGFRAGTAPPGAIG